MEESNNITYDDDRKSSVAHNPFQTQINRHAELEEVQPVLRHVAIGSVSRPTGRSLIELQRPSWTATPSHKGMTRPSGPFSTNAEDRSDGLVMKKEWMGHLEVPSNWHINDNDLQMVPLDFPLERTHREIHGSGACEIAGRISDAMRELSIEAEYDKAKAKCRTSDFVSFRIRLYAGGLGVSPVIVEVQKRSGQTMSFMRSCRAILGAAEGKQVSMQAKKAPSPFLLQPVGDLLCLKGVLPVQNSVENLSLGLDKVIALLRSNKRDSNLLGMENLCLLTNQFKTAPETASRAAICFIIGDNKFNLRDEVEALLQRNTETVELNDSPINGEVDYSEQIHHHALRLFSNCLELTAHADLLRGAIREQPWINRSLIPTLLDEIKEADHSPSNSHIAVLCLNSLICCSLALQRVLELNGLETLRTAKIVGKRCHKLLEIESERCIQILESGR